MPFKIVHNLRFYLLVTALAGSLLLISWLRLTIPSDQLFVIRVEQICGYITLLLWYIALIISPLGKQFSDWKVLPYLIFSRRAIGVSAAYFATLHVCFTFWGQMGGFSGMLLLPNRFRWALVFGAIAFAILLAMAATSIDKVIKVMTFRRWKILHRIGYFGGTLVILHIWLIGTHMEYLSFRSVIFIMLVILFWFEARRIAELLARRYSLLANKQAVIASAIWLVTVVVLWAIPRIIGSYSSIHSGAFGSPEIIQLIRFT